MTTSAPQILSLMSEIIGTVQGHRDGHGFVQADDGDTSVFLPPQEMRSVMHRDRVKVRVVRFDRRGRPEGLLLEIIERRITPIIGRLLQEGGAWLVAPEDRRFGQDILIAPKATGNAEPGQVVAVELTEPPSLLAKPVGRVVEVLGGIDDPGMEIEIALRTHGIPHTWPEEVTKEVAGLGEQVPEKAKEGRIDLRALPLVTIDGEDARDFDDAVFCEAKRGGGWRLWVAIADVSAYVKPGTALDTEAYQRGNSVYFPEFVVPMLPEVLSNGLCSLNPQVDRLCMVCEMTISAAGRMSGYKFYEAVMNSHARLTYTKVAAILDGDPKLRQQYDPLVGHIEELSNLYKALKHARHQRGAVEFESEETRFIFNAQRKIDRIVPLVRNDAHKIIEECMIQANVAAARYIEKNEAAALFRVHDRPGEERLTGFRDFLAELGLELKGGLEPEPKDFADLAAKFEGRPDAELLSTMLLRSMRQAIYQADNIGHFGLALKSYAHFTSPIRRYPDLILHRAIKYQTAKEQQANLRHKWTPSGGYHYQLEEVDPMGEHCSMTERRADDATRDVADWLKCEYMLDHVGDEFDGVIASVTGFGFFVRLAEIHIDGLVHVSTLTNDYYQFDPLHQQLIGENFRRRYRLGDKVRVKVMGVNLDDRKIDFVMVEEPLKATGKNAKEMARKQAEIKKEKAKSAQRHEKRKEGKESGKSDKGGRAKPSNRRPSKKARDKAKSTK